MAVKFVLSVAFLRAAREKKKRKVHFNNTPQNGRLRVVFFGPYPVDDARLVNEGYMQVGRQLQLIELVCVS